MKILVTGGAGYIGSHIVRLLEKDHEITVYDSLVNGHMQSINTKLVQGCLSDTELLEKTFSEGKFDAVIHTAGFIEAGESMTNPGKYFWNNTANGLNLLNVMVKHNVKNIVYASTAAVYGEPKEVPITEDSEKKPTNYYGLSKLMYENIMDTFKVYGVKSIALRFFNASGADLGIGEDHSPETHLIPLILQVPLGKRKEIKIFGTDYETKDGTCIRDYVHVIDIARAHKLALDMLIKGKDGKYNIGSGGGYSVREVIETARKVTGHPIPAVETGRRDGDPAILIASNEKAKIELEWEPEYDLKEIIKSAWEWHRNNPDGFNKKS
jgi:UDP-glucose 4-epimerase